MDKLIAYKGFDKDLKCNDFQYEVGKEYELPNGEKPEICSKGFHACESPLEVLDYYFLDDKGNLSRFCVVEQSGEFSKRKNSTKVASSKIKIKEEITFPDLIKSGVEWLNENTSPEKVVGDDAQIGSSAEFAKISSSGDFAQIGSSGEFAKIGSTGDFAKIGSIGSNVQIGSSGDRAQIGSCGERAIISSSGDRTQIGSNGDYAKIASSGNFAQINSTGEASVIMCAGHNSRAKAKKGSWITLAEWYEDDSCEKIRPKCVKTEYVDGERIKADTWYKLVDGEFVILDKPED